MRQRLVLASGSPRRRELLGMLGLEFEVVLPLIDETPHGGESPIELVSRLAPAKAVEVAQKLMDPGSQGPPPVDGCLVVIAADTVVDLSGRILGTPESRHEAGEMLRALSGRSHLVHTGVAVMVASPELSSPESLSPTLFSSELFTIVTTEVVFDRFSDAMIDWYLSSGESLDKAGAYGLQGIGGVLVREVRGSVSNVIGLPMVELRHLLDQVGIEPRA